MKKRRIPHLGLIPDGGRRWAKREKVPLVEAYSLSMVRIEAFLRAFFSKGTEEISVYLLSRANLQRSNDDLGPLFVAVRQFVQELRHGVCDEFEARVSIVGRAELLPLEFQQETSWTAQANGFPRTVNLCLAYDPFDELAHSGLVLNSHFSRRDILDKLQVRTSLDLIFRTGGAITLSNFLPLQSAYARIHFLDDLFNDCDLTQFERAYSEHEAADLQYGT